MRKIRTKRGLLGTPMAATILGIGYNTEQSALELHVGDSIRKTSVTALIENIKASKTTEECCRVALDRDGNANITIYSDSADHYVAEGSSYREFPLRRLTSGNADDLHTIHTEDVLEFDGRGYIYGMSFLELINNLSHDALSRSTYNEKVFLISLPYTSLGFIWSADTLEQCGLKLSENLDGFLDVYETLKENGILPYGVNRDLALIAPVMCAGLYDIYQGDDYNQKLKTLSDDMATISEYTERGSDFLQMMIDKGYMNPE